MRWFAWLILLLPTLATAQVPIGPGRVIEQAIAPGQIYTASLRLRQGKSADVVVLQQGIDLVVDLLGPDGRLLDSVDSPNGRDGEEPVAVMAERAGTYTIRIRPLGAGDPPGRFTLRLADSARSRGDRAPRRRPARGPRRGLGLARSAGRTLARRRLVRRPGRRGAGRRPGGGDPWQPRAERRPPRLRPAAGRAARLPA